MGFALIWLGLALAVHKKLRREPESLQNRCGIAFGGMAVLFCIKFRVGCTILLV